MRRQVAGVLPLVMMLLMLCGPAAAENWPGWRGPRGDGTSIEADLPLRWDGVTGDGIAWKVPIPGEGHGSPIVWADRIFLPSYLPETGERVLLCFDRRTGDRLWQQTVVTCPPETLHKLNSHASSTPATDGKLVYVTFLEVGGEMVEATNVGAPREVSLGHMVVAAYDFEGRQQWIARPGEFVSVHGFCSCPVLFEDLVIVNGDHDGESYVVGLDTRTGQTVWKTPREKQTRSYCTPIIRQIDGEPQMVMSGSHRIVSFDPRDGSRNWLIEGPTEQFVASMVYDGERFFAAAGFPTHHVIAVNPTGTGDVTRTHVEWHVTTAKCYVPSPVLVGDYLLVADDRGTANCFDARTGDRYWQGRMGRHFSASLIGTAEFAWFTADDGITKIVRPGPELEVIHENRLGEFTYASPAVSQGHIYIRGVTHLYAIGG
jgi:outer membrane protein assembly factor BamB